MVILNYVGYHHGSLNEFLTHIKYFFIRFQDELWTLIIGTVDHLSICSQFVALIK